MPLKLLIIFILLVSLFVEEQAHAAEKRPYGLLLGTFSCKTRGVEAWRNLHKDKKLTGVSVLLARKEEVYYRRPGYLLIAGPFSFASKAQRLSRSLERAGMLVRTIPWPAPESVVAQFTAKGAERRTCRLPDMPPPPSREQEKDWRRQSLTEMQLQEGTKLDSDLYYDDVEGEVGNTTSVKIQDGRIAHKVYTEFSPSNTDTDDLEDVEVHGEVVAETPMAGNKLRGIVAYNFNQLGSERLSLSHVWEHSRHVETEVGLGREIGENSAGNAFGSVSKKIGSGVRLTQRMDLYTDGELKAFSGIGLTF